MTDRPATYQDVLEAWPGQVAEVLAGQLYLQPRPAAPHARAASVLGVELGGPFDHGKAGPGGWILLDEPELHLGPDILVPDLAGWRRDRLSALPNAPFLTLVPDWVCEVLSPRTARQDRTEKLPIYARENVRHVWLVDPLARTLEVLRLVPLGWLLVNAHAEDERVRAEPFDAIELELGALWAEVEK